MRICFAALYYGPAWLDVETYLTHATLHRHLPQALAARGHAVSVVQLFPRSHRVRRGGVDYHFVASSAVAGRAARAVGRLRGHGPALYEPAVAAIHRIRALRPDVLHVHGTHLHLNLCLLRLLLGRKRPPIVMHYHGGFVPRHPLARRLLRFNLRPVDRFLFTTQAHAAPFVEAGLMRDPERVVAFMETSSPFRMRPREVCRRETGMTGHPVLLWTGRLHPIKDPLTVLRGFEAVLKAWPEAHLYAYYRTAELLPEVEAFLAARPGLRAHVHLRGTAPFHEMEALYNSADFLVQASRREFSGCAVLEAMSCGTIPVVTDLPSFRAMTQEGRYGVLFSPGDAEAMARRLRAVPLAKLPQRRADVQAHFERALSFSAMAEHLERIYEKVVIHRSQHESGI